MAPLYLEFMHTLTPHFHWIAAAQSCSLRLVAKRIGLWLNRVFDTAEDYRVLHALPKVLEALREMFPYTWRSYLHVSTSPVPRAVGDVDDAILDKGLGQIGDFPLPQDPWDSVVPEFYRDGLRDFNVEESPEDGYRVVKGASRWVSQQAERPVSAPVGGGGVPGAPGPTPPTCYLFVIPKSSEKVSLILSCVKQNKRDKSVPLTFRLDFWKDLARALLTIPPGHPLFVVHIDLKNAIWSFRLPPQTRRIFRFRPSPGLPAVELERLPFGWKQSPYFCQTAQLRVLHGVLPPGVLLVHYLDDFLVAYTEEGVLREAGRTAVRALAESGIPINPKGVLDPLQLVSFLGKALNLASRMVACHTQALLQLWVVWMRLALGGGARLPLRSCLGLLNWHVRPLRLGCPFGAGAWCWVWWGRKVDGEQQPSHGLPVKLLEGLATLAALAAEPWAAPARRAWPHLTAFTLARSSA